MKKLSLLTLGLFNVVTLMPMRPIINDSMVSIEQEIKELEASLAVLPAEVKDGTIENKWTNLIDKKDVIQPSRREYMRQLNQRTLLQGKVDVLKEQLETLKSARKLEDARSEVIELTAQNQSLQKAVVGSQKQIQDMLNNISKLTGESKISEGKLKQWREDNLRLALAKEQSQAQALKYAQQLSAKNQELLQQQMKAQEQEKKLMQESNAILDSATRQGELTAQQIKKLTINMGLLESKLASNKALLSECLMNKGLFESRPAQASALTRIMNWFRSKKSTAQ